MFNLLSVLLNSTSLTIPLITKLKIIIVMLHESDFCSDNHFDNHWHNRKENRWDFEYESFSSLIFTDIFADFLWPIYKCHKLSTHPLTPKSNVDQWLCNVHVCSFQHVTAASTSCTQSLACAFKCSQRHAYISACMTAELERN